MTGCFGNGYAVAIDSRLLELGLAEAGDSAHGAGRYYGVDAQGREIDQYNDQAVRDLGLMPDGTFSAPAVAVKAAAVEAAGDDLMAARHIRDQARDADGAAPLPLLDAVCWARVHVARAEAALAAAIEEQRAQADRFDPDGAAARLDRLHERFAALGNFEVRTRYPLLVNERKMAVGREIAALCTAIRDDVDRRTIRYITIDGHAVSVRVEGDPVAATELGAHDWLLDAAGTLHEAAGEAEEGTRGWRVAEVVPRGGVGTIHNEQLANVQHALRARFEAAHRAAFEEYLERSAAQDAERAETHEGPEADPWISRP